jgi:hypothetical protein
MEGLLYRDGSSEPDKVKCADMDHITDGFGYWIEYEHPIRVSEEAAFELGM